MNKKPNLGDIITVRGIRGRIVKIHPFGTVDVVTDSGAHYRITGLPFL